MVRIYQILYLVTIHSTLARLFSLKVKLQLKFTYNILRSKTKIIKAPDALKRELSQTNATLLHHVLKLSPSFLHLSLLAYGVSFLT